MTERTIYKAFWCHVCVDPQKKYINASNLRVHLKDAHGMSEQKELELIRLQN
jgi:hypothetical protein